MSTNFQLSGTLPGEKDLFKKTLIDGASSFKQI